MANARTKSRPPSDLRTSDTCSLNGLCSMCEWYAQEYESYSVLPTDVARYWARIQIHGKPV